VTEYRSYALICPSGHEWQASGEVEYKERWTEVNLSTACPQCGCEAKFVQYEDRLSVIQRRPWWAEHVKV
jgi:hypothetical protein